MIKSLEGKKHLERIKNTELNTETKFVLFGMTEMLAELKLIEHNEFIELADMLEIPQKELEKINY